MKRIAALLLTVILLAACPALAQPAFSLRSGVTWDSTMMDVMRMEGTPDSVSQMTYSICMYLDAAVSNYQAEMDYVFAGEDLAAVQYVFRTHEDSASHAGYKRQYIRGALTQKYGNPGTISGAESEEIMARIYDYPFDPSWEIDNRACWALADGTRIIWYEMEIGFSVLYVNPLFDTLTPAEYNTSGL
ncbi:MAG: hypothetical protein J6K32_11060 [Clostridia bacterium]|nr:hypothetical protein [Clostridia bacterium]